MRWLLPGEYGSQYIFCFAQSCVIKVSLFTSMTTITANSDSGSIEACAMIEALNRQLESISDTLLRCKDCITRWTQDPKSKLKVQRPSPESCISFEASGHI